MSLDRTNGGPASDQASGKEPRSSSLLLLTKLILIGGTILAASEASWRLTGAQPLRSDLLAFDRLRGEVRNSSSAVALIGSSRVLCDLDPRVLKRELPQWDFYQLGIAATSALPMLENLAGDVTFRGQVLCEFHISYVADEYPFPERDAGDAPGPRYIHFIQRLPYLDFATAWLTETLRPRSALVEAKDKDKDFPSSLSNTVRHAVASVRHHRSASRVPEPDALLPDGLPRDDRFLALHHRGRDNSGDIAVWIQMEKNRSGKAAVSVQYVASLVERIRRHGGNVVFVRLPITGSLKSLEDALYPDQDGPVRSLAEDHITVIDFTKEPSLDLFDCPDESHLDADDAERFSAALSRILRDRQLLRRPASEKGGLATRTPM
jgi:hypothetical protein